METTYNVSIRYANMLNDNVCLTDLVIMDDSQMEMIRRELEKLLAAKRITGYSIDLADCSSFTEYLGQLDVMFLSDR